MIGRSIGKYRILERIGRGGMGTVYRAIDESLQREVAIKVLNAEVTEPESLKRFRAEAITLARLQHPAIATLFELTEDDGDLLMVMEFVRGETLQKLAERMGKVPPDFAAQLCSQALDGLWHAHRAGIVHRDLKPGNLMVTGDGIVKVMDFGIARIAGSEHLTSDGFTMGTPAYMAPEQVRGAEVDARSDIYSMGVVLYRLWTGQLPFQGETPFAIAHRQLNEDPIPLKIAAPELPSWCELVLSRALAKNPDERYQTALEFKNALATAATFMSLDDVATVTLRTPRAVLLPPAAFSTSMPSSASMPSSGSGESVRLGGSTAVQSPPPEHTPAPPPASGTGATERPATGSPPATGRTVVISPRQVFAGVSSLMIVIVVIAIGTVLAVKRIQDSREAAIQSAAAAPPTPTPAPEDSAAPTATTPDPSTLPAAIETPPASASTPAAPSGSPSTTATSPASSSVTAPAPVTPNKAAPPGATKTASPAPPTSAAANAAAKPSPPSAPPVPAPPQPEPPSAPPATAAPSADAQPAVAFDKIKLLIVDGDKAREDDAELRFANGNVQIIGASQKVVGSFPYQSVHTVTSTRSKQPRWKGPDGAVVDAKMGGGAFGFLKSDKNWVGLVTAKATYVFRVEDGDLQNLTRTAVQRTGAPLVRLAGK
jgi:serine/threonine-protein kinase